MLILNGKVPKVGDIYVVANTTIQVSVMQRLTSYSESGKTIDMLEGGEDIVAGEQVLLLEKDLMMSKLIAHAHIFQDFVMYKFLALKQRQIIYWRATPLIKLVNTATDLRDASKRAEHNFAFNFLSLKNYLTFNLKKGQ